MQHTVEREQKRVSVSSEIRAALEANSRFYEVFADGDSDAMDGLWATTTPVLCTHPGSETLHGRDVVMRSWNEILDRPPPIAHSGGQVAIIRGVAFVSCLEHIGDGTLAATNIFVWEDQEWRLVHHQAGPLHEDLSHPPAKGGPLH
jgi:hypothetical protein